jgi:uncharacterized membrane protein required for colicin V production
VGAALFYWQVAGRALASRWGIGSLVAYGLAFILLFLGPFIVLRLLGGTLRRLSKVVLLGGADRLAGAALGAVTGTLVVGGGLSLLGSTRWGQTLVGHSAVARPLVSVFRQLLRQAGL